MDNIDLLYCSGCSFTRMASRRGFPEMEHQWPHLLGQRMGVEIVNDAIWNGSNSRTFRKLETFLNTFPIDPTRIFCLIQFTFPWRFEMPHPEDLTDYTWRESAHKENWIRLNPGHFDIEKYYDKDESIFTSVAVVPDKPNLPTISEGLDKIHGKLIRYTDEVERLDQLKYIYAIKGLLDAHGCKYKFITGDSGRFDYDLTSDFLPTTLKMLMGDNVGVDGMHANLQGNMETANKLYEYLMSDTDK